MPKAKREDPAQELQTFNIADVAITALSTEYMPLTIAGLEDKEGYKKVHIARMVIKGKRVEVEKRHKEIKKYLKERIEKELKETAAEADRLLGLLQPIEDHLGAQEKAIDDQKEIIRTAAKREAEAKEKFLDDWEAALVENTRLENEKEAARLRKIADEQAEKEKALQVDQERVNKIKHEQEIEQARKDAAEKTRIEFEKEAEKSRNQIAIDAEFSRLKQEKKKAEAPDKEKLTLYIADIQALSDNTPVLSSINGPAIIHEVKEKLRSAREYLKAQIKNWFTEPDPEIATTTKESPDQDEPIQW